jgi:UDPglucose 6-dehydrogenase
MKVAVIGSGYVGLVVGACLAESGNDVVCADIDEGKVERLNRGEIPIYEPGLEPLIESNVKAGRLRYSTDVVTAVRLSDVVFIAVGTPPGEDGSADLQHVLGVARTIGEAMNGEKIVITKSTVPVGTAQRVRAEIEARTDFTVHVCSNPEFLKEGAAVDDFMKPDRVVLGVDSDFAAEVLRDLYAPFVRSGASILLMDVPSAEITKYAANAMLATRISFMNSIAQLCDRTGADINNVRTGVGSDARIGSAFLYAGAGYGGSCLAGGESVLARRRGRARLWRLDELFEDQAIVPSSAPGDLEPEVAWADDLLVLSWDSSSGPRWRAASAVTRRWFEGELLEIGTKLGRRVRCTPDHPFVVADGEAGTPVVKLARDLGSGDWVPLAFAQPQMFEEPDEALELAGSLQALGFRDEQVIVRLSAGARSSLERGEVMAAVAGHPRGRSRAQDILRTGALRLNELRGLDVPFSEASFGSVRNGTYVPDSFAADARFWRVVGLYLAEGHCTRDGRRMRLQWSFHPTAEPDLVEEVAGFWRSQGVRAGVRRGTTTCNVTVSSRILATWWLRELGVGADCYSHRLPDAVWDLQEEHQLALLSGLWHGDGSWSFVNGGPSVVLEWGTVSRTLADGAVRLLGGLGIGARLKVGRTAKSTTDTYWVVVSGADQVEKLVDFVKPADRAAVLNSIGRQAKRIAPTGYRPAGHTAWLRVVGSRRIPFKGWVYSLEVPGTETFVTTAGLVVHNCFPKDVKALIRTMRDMGADASILEAVEAVNDAQKGLLLSRVVERFGEDLAGRSFAVWGLAFKPNTDDMREAPSLVTVEGLLERGARVAAHDPVAMDEARRHFGDRITYGVTNYDTLGGADALIIHTEWQPYRNPDFTRMKAALREPVIFDGRNLWDPEDMAERGFEYACVGRGAGWRERGGR